MARRVLTYELCKEIASHYPNAKALERADQAACNKSRQQGWLKQFYPDMGPRIMNGSVCRESAKHFNTRTEWHEGDRASWDYAKEHELMDELFPDIVVRQSSVTFDDCVRVSTMLQAKGFTKRTDLKNYDVNMYNVANDRGWMDKLGFQSKDESFRQAGLRCSKYTVEYAYSVAKQYELYDEFKNNEPDLYDWCCRHKIIRDFTWLARSKHLKYNDHELLDLAKQYKEYGEFRQNEPGAYSAILKNKKKWIISFLQRNAVIKDGVLQDFIYVYEFPETQTAYVGRAVNVKCRHRDHCTKTNDPIFKYSLASGIAVPTPKLLIENITIKDSGALEDRMIKLYRALGWNMLNTQPGGSLGGIGHGKWTLAKMIEAAHECVYWDDLVHKYPSVYGKICRLKIRDKFPWLKLKRVPDGTWQSLNEVEAYVYAMPFTTRKEFADQYPVLAKIARDAGWMVKWFPDEDSTVPKRVCQYTLDGVKVATFDNMIIAAQQTGIKSQCIGKVIRGGGRTAGNFVWALESTSLSNITFPGSTYKKRGAKRKVYQLTTDGQIIKLYNSITEGALKLGISPKRISDVLSGNKKLAGGYKWKYAEAA